jgi:trimeric autotransporter adhesin
MVTNADETTSVETLAQAGVASIDLSANNVKQTLSDGSSIDGETSFTTTSGTTGTAATVTFAVDPNGYVVQSTTTTDATTGAVTIDNKAHANGSLANETISTTSVDGMARTIRYDLTGNGQIDVIQTDNTVISNGVTTETLTDATFAGVLIDRTVFSHARTRIADWASADNGQRPHAARLSQARRFAPPISPPMRSAA